MAQILVITANSGQRPLRLATEIRMIREAVGRSINFQVADVPDARTSDLIERLRSQRIDILHFAGHGAGPGEDALLLVNDRGEEETLSARSLGRILDTLAHKPSVVVMNACYSDGFHEHLARHVDAVIGVDGEIDDGVALRFCSRFYDAISHGSRIGDAVEVAKLDLRAAGVDEDIIMLRPTSPGALSKSFRSAPTIQANFRLRRDGTPKRTGNDYHIDLWIDGASENIGSVTFQICDKTFPKSERFWEVSRQESETFLTDDIRTYGDFRLRATAWARDQGFGVETRLSDALRDHHGTDAPAAISAALEDIRKN